MSQPQTLTVDQQEILARANEVEAPMAEPPTNAPAAPCTLTAAQNAAEQLDLSAENMRTFLAAGHRERQRLATSLRNAAKAYGEVDDESATALNSDGNGNVEAESAGGAGGDSSAGLQDTPQVAAAGDPGFTDLKTAATKIGSGDQGVSLSNFADAWTKLNFALQRDVKRFRPFDNWQGDAATACEASLDQQREWIVYMAQLAAALAKQANYIAQLQYWARTNHPTLADIESLEQDMKDPNKKSAAMKVYAEYQSKSEQVLKEYNDKANLEAINPKKPPAAIKIDPPPPAQPQGLIPSFLMPPGDGSGGGTGGMPPMAPMAPTAGAGGGMPPSTAAELTAAGREAAASLPSDVSVKAASLGGGGGGGGMPSMPLAPATGIDGESVRPAAAGDLGGAAAGRTASGSGMAGGGMGMPMGAHGQGQGGSKSKGAQQDDEALYTEDRAWTEAVIGNRRRQDSKESK
ncbi:ESX-1 secretion-associated protein EspB [Mycobacterium simulans]|uniref:ESX-1 secretion-associated protein EspB n=1 Tax=Mycobacterium simulans TaxID=627089 RepID=A0A7Z7NCM1_9MYCO|nr:secretion protein EspB [Mycobacterium simulans]SOJ58065.1 ESX-1 secretion-associated protein EspB [Mycobacterium simulans]